MSAFAAASAAALGYLLFTIHPFGVLAGDGALAKREAHLLLDGTLFRPFLSQAWEAGAPGGMAGS